MMLGKTAHRPKPTRREVPSATTPAIAMVIRLVRVSIWARYSWVVTMITTASIKNKHAINRERCMPTI